MNEPQELYDLKIGAYEEEREYIIELIGKTAQQQAEAGDIDGAQILTEMVRLIQLDAQERGVIEEVIDQDEQDALDAAGDESATEMLAEVERDEKQAFDRELGIEPADGLPPVREKTDEDVMATMTSARMRQM